MNRDRPLCSSPAAPNHLPLGGPPLGWTCAAGAAVGGAVLIYARARRTAAQPRCPSYESAWRSSTDVGGPRWAPVTMRTDGLAVDAAGREGLERVVDVDLRGVHAEVGGESLPPPQPAIHIPTGLAVPDPTRRPSSANSSMPPARADLGTGRRSVTGRAVMSSAALRGQRPVAGAGAQACRIRRVAVPQLRAAARR